MRRLAAFAAALVLLAPACGADGDLGAGTAGTPSPADATPPGATPPGATGSPGGTPSATSPPALPTSPVAPAPSATPAPTGAGDGQPGLSAGAWTRFDQAPRAFTEVAATALAGRVLTAGGFVSTGQAVSDVLVYDPIFDQWEAGPPLPVEVHHTALVSTGSEVLQIGGYAGDGFGVPSAGVHRLDPATGAWEAGAPLPEPRAAGAAAWDGTRVVYAGGVGPDGLAGDVYVLDLEAGRWSRLGALEQPREHVAAASDGAGRVWFLGGRTSGLDDNLASVELVEGDAIRTVGDLPTARGGLAGFYHPHAGACAAGGERSTRTFAEVECLDAEGTVTVLPPLGVARHGLGVAVVDGVAYAVLGGQAPGLTVSAAVEALLLE